MAIYANNSLCYFFTHISFRVMLSMWPFIIMKYVYNIVSEKYKQQFVEFKENQENKLTTSLEKLKNDGDKRQLDLAEFKKGTTKEFEAKSAKLDELFERQKEIKGKCNFSVRQSHILVTSDWDTKPLKCGFLRVLFAYLH